MKKLFFFNMIFFKGWKPRNTSKMEKELEFALLAVLAMVD